MDAVKDNLSLIFIGLFILAGGGFFMNNIIVKDNIEQARIIQQVQARQLKIEDDMKDMVTRRDLDQFKETIVSTVDQRLSVSNSTVLIKLDRIQSLIINDKE